MPLAARCPMTIIWTHQGDGIENTLPAFASAWSKGITHFETDIQATKDGVLVLSHDLSIKRLTGYNLPISELTLDELQRYKIHGEFQWTLLAELLASFPSASISIDMKSKNTLQPLVANLTGRSNLENLVVGSFNQQRIKNFRRELPGITTAMSVDEVLRLKISGELSKHSPKNLFAMIPSRYSGMQVITAKFAASLQELGIPWHVWTVNSLPEMQYLKDLGATGVITDDVELALRALNHS